MVYKILRSFKGGTFKEKLYKKTHRIYRMKNQYAATIEKQARVYKKLEKKYKRIIENHQASAVDDRHTSKYVWICWFQGEENAPPLIKACIRSVKKNLPDRKVVILTNDNISQYIQLPEYIVKRHQEGHIGAAHYSDIIRVELLCKYGGTWIDSTVLCTSDQIPSCMLNAPLFVFKEMDLLRDDCKPVMASNWFISAQSGNPILMLTRELLYEYWKDYAYAKDYFIFHIFFSMSARKYKKEWNEIPLFNNHNPHVLMFELGDDYIQDRWEQIKGFSVFHKLTRHVVFENKDSFYQHIIKGEIV